MKLAGGAAGSAASSCQEAAAARRAPDARAGGPARTLGGGGGGVSVSESVRVPLKLQLPSPSASRHIPPAAAHSRPARPEVSSLNARKKGGPGCFPLLALRASPAAARPPPSRSAQLFLRALTNGAADPGQEAPRAALDVGLFIWSPCILFCICIYLFPPTPVLGTHARAGGLPPQEQVRSPARLRRWLRELRHHSKMAPKARRLLIQIRRSQPRRRPGACRERGLGPLPQLSISLAGPPPPSSSHCCTCAHTYPL